MHACACACACACVHQGGERGLQGRRILVVAYAATNSHDEQQRCDARCGPASRWRHGNVDFGSGSACLHLLGLMGADCDGRIDADAVRDHLCRPAACCLTCRRLQGEWISGRLYERNQLLHNRSQPAYLACAPSHLDRPVLAPHSLILEPPQQVTTPTGYGGPSLCCVVHCCCATLPSHSG